MARAEDTFSVMMSKEEAVVIRRAKRLPSLLLRTETSACPSRMERGICQMVLSPRISWVLESARVVTVACTPC